MAGRPFYFGYIDLPGHRQMSEAEVQKEMELTDEDVKFLKEYFGPRFRLAGTEIPE